MREKVLKLLEIFHRNHNSEVDKFVDVLISINPNMNTYKENSLHQQFLSWTAVSLQQQPEQSAGAEGGANSGSNDGGKLQVNIGDVRE